MDFRSLITQVGVPVVTTARVLTVSTPLTGGGDLSANRTIGLSFDSTLQVMGGSLGVSALVATAAALTAHSGRTDNPHAVTAMQAGALPLTGGVITGNLTVGNQSSNASLGINGGAGYVRDMVFSSGGFPRWIFRVESTQETGGDAGSHLIIMSRHDDGSTNSNVATFYRGTGAVGFSSTNITAGGNAVLHAGNFGTYAAAAAHTHSYQPLDTTLTQLAALGTTVGLVKQTSAGVYGIDTSAYSVTSHTHSYQPLDTTLTQLAALGTTVGFVKQTSAGVYGIDTSAYSTTNHIHPASAITSGILAVAQGGTGVSSQHSFNVAIVAASAAIASATITLVNWTTTAVAAVGVAFDFTNNSVLLSAGLWLVTVSTTWNAMNPPLGTYLQVLIYEGPTAASHTVIRYVPPSMYPPQSNGTYGKNFTYIIDANGSTYFSVKVRQTSGANQTLYGDSGKTVTSWQGIRLGL
ncbi:hypothetical protein EKD04_009380 [Chloroflexales bacterium ZM16-3]|nr:hypothetical protein [Chloroflexales bacterium ZM16-3]